LIVVKIFGKAATRNPAAHVVGVGRRVYSAKVFAVSADNLLNDSEDSVVEMQNHELNEQLMLIDQLDDDDKHVLYRMIDAMLTKKKFLDFYQKNIAAI
jgi:hypothetical protein